MKVPEQRPRAFRLLPPLVAAAVLAAGLLVPAWLFPGFIECRGYTEPANWVALYAPGTGVVESGYLADGMDVDKGTTLLVLDTSWPEYNLRRISGELDALAADEAYLGRAFSLFSAHQEVEEGELHRLMEADRILEASSSVSMNELLHSEYLYHSYLASSSREEEEILHGLESVRSRIRELELERVLWEEKLSDCTLKSPETGVFFGVKALFAPEATEFIPLPGPGCLVDEGSLLGYVVPDRSLEVVIRIPESRAGRCRVGQRVLLVSDSRPNAAAAPAEGFLASISSLASCGSVEAVVSVPPFYDREGFLCGRLTARIDFSEDLLPDGFCRLWERWVFLVNPA